MLPFAAERFPLAAGLALSCFAAAAEVLGFFAAAALPFAAGSLSACGKI